MLWWLNGIFAKGYRSVTLFLGSYDLDSDLASDGVAGKAQKAWNAGGMYARYSKDFLSRALGGQFMLVLFPRLCLVGFTFAQPFLISRILNFLGQRDNEGTQNQAYGLIASTALIYTGIAISYLLSSHNLYRLITMFRGAAVSLIYNHTLNLREGTYDRSAAVTLMSNDVDQITFCLEELNECWSRLLEVVIALPLLTRQLGWVSITPLIIVLCVGSSVVAKLIAKSQRIWADATQRRITLTSAVLSQMKIIKMIGLSDIMSDAVQKERIRETRQMESWAWIIVWLNTIANNPIVMTPAATFAVYAIQATIRGAESLNTVQAFTSLALISLLANPASRLLHAVPNTARSIGSFDRIQTFLLLEPREDLRVELDAKTQSCKTDGLSLRRRGSDSRYSKVSTVYEGEGHLRLVVRVKSAHIKPSRGLEFALRDVNLNIEAGQVVIVLGPVGSGKSTLIKALLGEVPYDSGSIEIAVGRVGYCAQSPWVVNGTIKEAICGFGEDETDEVWYGTVLEACALRYDLSNLSAGDQTIVGSRGITLSGGQKQRVALARAIYSRAKILLLDDTLSALDSQTEREIMARLFKRDGLLRKMGTTVLLVTHATQYLDLADQIIFLALDGTVRQEKPDSLRGTGIQLGHSGAEMENQPVFHNETIIEPEIDFSAVEAEVEARDLKRQAGDIEVYDYYFKSVGGLNLIMLVAFVLVNVMSASFSQIWLKWWTDIDGHQVALYASIYVLLAIAFSMGEAGYAWATVVVIAPSTGRKLHQILLRVVMKAPVSFFAATDLGSLLNRFSQDMSVIEANLASGVLATVSSLFTTLAQAGLVALGSPWLVLTVPILILRLLDLESRSPVYSHFLETLEGLSTIRAYGWETQFKQINLRRLDHSQKPYYLMFCIQRWLGLVLDLVVAAMAVIVVSLAMTLKGTTTVAFSESLSNLLRGWCLLETSLGAIARLRDFELETEVEEKDGEDMVPPQDWPSSGLVQIENLVAYYGTKKVLDNVTLSIQPGQTVAVCGRTGSGKSTLLSSILRTVDPSSGSIRIDSLDLSRLPRATVRERLIAVPQEPLQLNGSVRFNTDPFDKATDELIISALEKVALWPTLLERGGLDTEFGADVLSKGQQQLMALARALVQKGNGGRVALLDEATSSADTETSRVLNETLKREFADCTVLMVAHRKETILSADLVVVMDSGKVVEVGRPEDLMQTPDSRLRALLYAGDSELGK
ncbi:hypothetical protein MBLNU459_g2868t1 [Dothideomycetes sp. NU459]